MGYSVAHNKIGTVPNVPLASALGKELHPPPLLHAPPLSPGYIGQAAPAINWIGAVPDSSLPPDTIP